MFDVNKIAAVMSGENVQLKDIYFDMSRCIIQEDASTCRVLPKELEKVISEVIVKWPILENYKEDILRYYRFNVEELIDNLISSDPLMVYDIGSIIFDYPLKQINMKMHRDGDILSIYKLAKLEGDRVTGQSMGENVTYIISHSVRGNIDTKIVHVCIGCELGLSRGEVLPNIGLKLWTPVVLEDNNIYAPLIVDKDNREIEIRGTVRIESIVPLVAGDVKDIVIRGRGRLILVSTEDMQPCIGVRTATGLSWGRWCPSNSKPVCKIVIDGVEVVCEGKVDNFTLGKYGSDFIPDIELLNGGSIQCPEMKGRRVLTQRGESSPGSTKLSGYAMYDIVPIDAT